MNTIDLGFKVPDYGSPLSKPEPDKETPTKTAYPSMTIVGNKALAKSLKPGQKIKAMVTFRVCEVAVREREEGRGPSYDDQYGGTRVELEAENMTMDGVKIEDSDEKDGVSAFKEYMSKKASKTGDNEEEED